MHFGNIAQSFRTREVCELQMLQEQEQLIHLSGMFVQEYLTQQSERIKPLASVPQMHFYLSAIQGIRTESKMGRV